MQDTEIISLYWARDERAIAETSAKYNGYCGSIAGNILDSREDAQECVNETFLAAWNSIPPHRPQALATFLGKLTRRIAIDRWRKLHAAKRGGGRTAIALEELQECIAGQQDVAQEAERRQLREAVRTFILALPDTEQRIFLCRYWYMDAVEDIAAQFGFSESKVKSMLHRTRGKLRAHLQKEGLQ